MGAEAPLPEHLASNIKPLKNGVVSLVNRHSTALTIPPAGAPLTPSTHHHHHQQPIMRPAPFKNAPPPPSFLDDDRSFRARHPYLVCILVVLVVILIVLGVLVLIFYLLYRPQKIVFKVDSASLSRVLVEAGPMPQTLGMTGLIVVTASIHNPNRFDFTYDNVTGNLTFGEDRQLAVGSVMEGRVHKQSTKKLDVNLELNTRNGGPKAAELSRAIVAGVVDSNFATTVTGTVKFFVLKRNYRAKISCNMTINLNTAPYLDWDCGIIVLQ